MSKGFLYGALLITIATFLSKLLGSLFRIPLQNIAGNEVLGIFTIVYPVYMAVLILSVAGIPLAISKLISEVRTNGQAEQVGPIFQTASILALAFGCTSFLFFMQFSHTISGFLGGEFTRPALVMVSTSLLIAPYMAVFRGFFQGYENMKPTAYSQVLEQFVRVVVIIAAAFLLTRRGYAPEMITAGVMGGSIVGAVASLVYLRRKFSRSTIKPDKPASYKLASFLFWAKKILLLSIPLCIGTLGIALIYFVDSFTVPSQLEKLGMAVDGNVADLYGFYGRGLALVQIAVVFANGLVLPIIPAITASMTEGNMGKTKALVEKALYLILLTSWPITIGLFVLTGPINYVMFGDFKESTVIAVTLLSALLTAFSVLTTGVLQGMNRMLSSSFIIIGFAGAKIGFNVTFVNLYGLLGVAVSTVLTFLLISAANLLLIKKTIAIPLLQRSYFAFTTASVIMGGLLYLPVQRIEWVDMSRIESAMLLGGLIVAGALVYVFLTILLKGVTRNELIHLPVIGKHLSGGKEKTISSS